MIVCSCQRISDSDIRSAVEWMRAADPHSIVTPGRVYRALGKAAECGGCMKLFVASMRECPGLEVPAELRGLRTRPEPREDRHERRQEGS